MLEIIEELVEVFVKKSDPHRDKWCLVYKGTQLIALVPPNNSAWASKSYMMLVGTEQELRDVIKQLNLTISSSSFLTRQYNGI